MVRSSIDIDPLDEKLIRSAIRDLPLGGLRFFKQTGSTNDVALEWASASAPDLALVVAEEQISGRGRSGRQWVTVPGAALAFSLVLNLGSGETQNLSRFSGLGALAVVDALKKLSLSAAIKWPNDVLLEGRKVCGILVEAAWVGEKVEHMVLGIGINVRPEAVPPSELLTFPATSLQEVTKFRIARVSLLRDILVALLAWRPLVASQKFLHEWEHCLAFRGEQVEVATDKMAARAGRLEGLNRDGSLRLTSPDGEAFSVQFGEIHLRRVV